MAARGRRVETPDWALDFVNHVWQGEKGKPFPYQLIFKSTAHIPFRGGVGGQAIHQWKLWQRLVVEVGKPYAFYPISQEEEIRFVLLHEIGHLLLPITVNHEARFYRKALSLYEKYLTPKVLEYAVKREREYMPRGLNSAVKLLKMERYL